VGTSVTVNNTVVLRAGDSATIEIYLRNAQDRTFESYIATYTSVIIADPVRSQTISMTQRLVRRRPCGWQHLRLPVWLPSVSLTAILQ
jgi:hypothetical protein